MGNTKETIAQMNKVLEQDKDHVQALNYLAYTYAEMGNHLDEASALAHHALELQPNDGYILDTIGWIQFKKGEVEEAIKYLEAAVKARPMKPSFPSIWATPICAIRCGKRRKKCISGRRSLSTIRTAIRRLMEKIANMQAQSRPDATASSALLPVI